MIRARAANSPVSAGIIFIASSQGDRAHTTPVKEHLHAMGYKVMLYEADRVSAGLDPFAIRVNQTGLLTFKYNDVVFTSDNIKAAWYRRPHDFGMNSGELRAESLAEQYRATQDTFWTAIADTTWLNSPFFIRRAEAKLVQLEVAATLGFLVPETLISNEWSEVEAMPYVKLAVKMPAGGVLHDDVNDTKLMYTTVLENDGSLPKQAMPYPGIWQPYIKKKREWRVTVVGEKVFSAAIETADTAKDDWRKHQLTSAVAFKKAQFPVDLEQKCVALLQYFNLRYGAFDFIEKPNGDIIFLEVNPDGQYMWLEKLLDLPISKAIAQELAQISAQNN